MNWLTKARIQSLVAVLPERLASPVYYSLQRRFGALRKINPSKYLSNAVRLAAALKRANLSLSEKRIFELGTGRTVNTPLGLWLAGARQVTTVDLNHYLRPELCEESIAWMGVHLDEVSAIFSSLVSGPEFERRLAKLVALPPGLKSLFECCGIEYLSPLDATSSGLPASNFDVYLSTNVIEHVPPEVLRGLFQEGARILRPGGLMVHYIDLRDHFYTSDPSISMVNFLQFSDNEWNRIAGNRYMYQNRMRAHEYLELFDESGFRVLSYETQTDPRSLEILRKGGIRIDKRFERFTPEDLAIVGFTVVGQFESAKEKP